MRFVGFVPLPYLPEKTGRARHSVRAVVATARKRRAKDWPALPLLRRVAHPRREPPLTACPASRENLNQFRLCCATAQHVSDFSRFKAVLKPPHSKRWRGCQAPSRLAKRLDCGEFTAAFGVSRSLISTPKRPPSPCVRHCGASSKPAETQRSAAFTPLHRPIESSLTNCPMFHSFRPLKQPEGCAPGRGHSSARCHTLRTDSESC